MSSMNLESPIRQGRIPSTASSPSEGFGSFRASTFMLFAAYSISFVSVFDRLGLGAFRNIAIICIGVYLLLNIRALAKALTRGPLIAYVAFVSWVILAAIINSFRVPGVDIAQEAVVALLPALEVGLILFVCSMHGQFHRAVSLFFYWQSILLFLNDAFVLAAPGLFGMESSIPSYFMGNKFSVVYGHLLLMVLFLIRRDGMDVKPEGSMLAFLSLFGLTIIVSLIVDCMTGIVGAALFLCFYFLISRHPHFFFNPVALIAVVLLSFLFVFAYKSVLSNGVVVFLLGDVLGTSTDITGRAQIYEQLPLLMSNNLMFGYGYGTGHILGPALGNFVNTQNGLAEWIWRAGIPSVVLLCTFIWQCVSRGKTALAESRQNLGIMAPPLAFLYTLGVLASVEVTIAASFFVMSFMLAAVAYRPAGS